MMLISPFLFAGQNFDRQFILRRRKRTGSEFREYARGVVRFIEIYDDLVICRRFF